MTNSVLFVMAVLLASLSIIVIVVQMLQAYRKRNGAEAQVEALDHQIFTMASAYMFQEGCVEALRGQVLGRKQLRTLSQDRATSYAEENPCSLFGYEKQLMSDFIEGYQEEQERVASTFAPQQPTTRHPIATRQQTSKGMPMLTQQFPIEEEVS